MTLVSVAVLNGLRSNRDFMHHLAWEVRPDIQGFPETVSVTPADLLETAIKGAKGGSNSQAPVATAPIPHPVEITIDLFRYGHTDDPIQFTKEMVLWFLPAAGSVLGIDFLSADVDWVRLMLDEGKPPMYSIRVKHIYNLPEDAVHIGQHLEDTGWERLPLERA